MSDYHRVGSLEWPLSPDQLAGINDEIDRIYNALNAVVPGGYTIGDLLYADSVNSLARLSDVAVGSYLRSGGVGAAPLWSTLKLPDAVTKGSVVFGSATNTYGQDNAKFFWDDTNFRLGIGTATPTRNLDIVGTMATTGASMGLIGSAGSESLFVFNSTAGATTFSAKTDGTVTLNGLNSFPTSIGLSINMAAGGAWTPMVVTSSGGSAGDTFVISAAGRVGIGAVSPAAILDVSGAGAVPDLIIRSVDSPAQNIIEVRSKNGFLSFKDAANSVQYGIVGGGDAGSVLTGLTGLRLASSSGPVLLQELGGYTVVGGLIALAGTTASFPALKRSSADLHVRLADDTAYANAKGADIYANTNNAGSGFIMLGGIAADRNYGGIWVGQSTPSFNNYSMLANAGNAQVLFNTPGGGAVNDIEFRISNAGRLHVGSGGVSINGTDNTAPTIPLTIKDTGKSNTLLTVSNVGVASWTAALTGLSASADKAHIITSSFSLSGNSTSVASLQLPAPTVTLGGFTLTNATTLDIAGAPSAGTNPRALWVRAGLSQFDGSVFLGAKMTAYNAVTTAGWGIPAVYGSGRSVAQAAAVASVATYTVGAADGSFEVSANVLVTTATSHAFAVQVAYTDEGNTARTLTLSFTLVAGGTLVTSVANANGAVPYMGIPQWIRCKAATSITIKTAGTFTTVAYNVEGAIIQIA